MYSYSSIINVLVLIHHQYTRTHENILGPRSKKNKELFYVTLLTYLPLSSQTSPGPVVAVTAFLCPAVVDHGLAVPVEGPVVPVEGPVVPVEDTVVPVEDTVVPVEDNVVPVEGSVVPVEGPVVPVEAPAVAAHDHQFVPFPHISSLAVCRILQAKGDRKQPPSAVSGPIEAVCRCLLSLVFLFGSLPQIDLV